MPEDTVGVIMRCAIECKEATKGLEELHKKAIKAAKIPPIKPPIIPKPEIPELAKEIPIPEVPKVEAPKIEKPVVPRLELPSFEPIKPELEIVKPKKAMDEFVAKMDEGTKTSRVAFEKLAIPMEASEEQLRKLSRLGGEELPRDWRKGYTEAGKAGLKALGPTQLVFKTAEGIGKMMGIEVPKITEKGAMQQIKMYRWIGRDLIRLGRMTAKVGMHVQKIFGAMTENSVALGSAVDDLRFAYEELTSELGEAFAPVLEPLVDLVWWLVDTFEEMPGVFKTAIAMFMALGLIILKIVPFLMMFRGYLLLNRFSLMQAAAATKTATVATSKYGKTTKKVSRVMRKFGRTMKMVTPMISGVGVAFMTIAMGGTLAEAAGWGLISAGMGMMMILPGWTKLIGGLVAGVGLLIQYLYGSKEEADKLPSSLIEMMESMEYTEEEAYDMGEQVWASFRMVNDSYQDAGDASDAFRYRMEELGFEVKDIIPLWAALGGSVEDVLPSFDTLRESFENLPASATHAMILIHAALDDGKITQEEWEYIINTSAWESFETRFGEMAGYIMSKISGKLKEGAVTLSDWEDAFGFFVFLEVQNGIWEKASQMWNKMKTYYSVNQIDLGDYIAPITDWTSYITELVWGDKVPPLGWDEFITSIDLSGYVTAPTWADIVSILILGDFITSVDLSDYITAPIWSDFVSQLTLGDYITGPNWLIKMDDLKTPWAGLFAHLSTYSLDLNDYITSPEWEALMAVPTWLVQYLTPEAYFAYGMEKGIISRGQKGGPVSETGLWLLHPGEYILPSGAAIRPTSNIISNTFNITATIREEKDIRTLADEISRLQKEEFRRA